MSAKQFGRRLLQARLDLASKRGKTVTKVEVGEALGVTSTTVKRWEDGEQEPTLAHIEKLGAVLQISPCYLAFGGDTGGGEIAYNPADHGQPVDTNAKRRRRA